MAAILAAPMSCKRAPQKKPPPAKPPPADVKLKPRASLPSALFLASDRAGRMTLFQLIPGQRRLRSVQGAEHGTVWSAVASPNGRAVATLHRVAGRRELRVLGPDTAGALEKQQTTVGPFDQLKAVSGNAHTVVWAAGRDLVVWQHRGDKTRLHRIPLGPLGRLTYGVALSTDGSRLAFSTFEKGCPARDRARCAVHLYGVTLGDPSATPVPLVKHAGVAAYNPRFTTADGQKLLYMSTEDDRSAACRDNVNDCRFSLRRIPHGGGPSELVVHRGVLPALAANGTLSFRRLLLDSAGRQDWKRSSVWIKPRGKQARRVPSVEVSLRYHHLSPQGRWLLLYRRVGQGTRLAVHGTNGTLAEPGMLRNRSRAVGWFHHALPAGSRQLRQPRAERRLGAALALARKSATREQDLALFGVNAAARLRLAPKLRAPAKLALLTRWLRQAPGRIALVDRQSYCQLRRRVLPAGGQLRVLGTVGIASAVADPGTGLVILRYASAPPGRAKPGRPRAPSSGGPSSAAPRVIATFDARDDGGGLLELVNVGLPGRVRIGDRLQMSLTWRVVTAPTNPWKIFVHVDGQGARILGDHVPALCGTDDWKVGTVVKDTFDLEVGSWRGLSPGQYRVFVGWFRGRHRARAQGSVPTQNGRAQVARLVLTR